MKLTGWIGLCLALLAGACERGTPAGFPEQPTGQEAAESLPGFVRRDARLRVAHSGIRRLEFAALSGPGLAFDERITTDGDGHYALEPAQGLESTTIDNGSFELLHHLREGFFFRYRDFVVRDARTFARNWRVIDRGQSTLIAGRTCARFRVERALGTACAYELCVDPTTELVLASEEYDGSGSLVASMTYASIDLTPNLSRVAWHQSGNEETSLDRAHPLGEQIQARSLEPRLLPQGYVPLEAAVVRAGDDAWLKLTYCDGVQPLFFLHSIDANSLGKAAQVDGQRIGATPRSPSSVVACQVGSATTLQGTVDGFEVIAVGKVSQGELLDLLESARP
ncbi:MAG: hypothetical protein EXS08_05255 [Planctomycetes bacterium]|nr:hypothetical protein [Planctomycetota bacterium]